MPKRKGNYNHMPEPPPPPVRIFMEGFISGIFAAFFVKTGINPDPSAQIGKVVETMYETAENINPDFDGTPYLFLYGAASFVSTIVGFLEIISLVNDRVVGSIIFVAGICVGFLGGLCIIH